LLRDGLLLQEVVKNMDPAELQAAVSKVRAYKREQKE
jgi:hypothetical protein